MTNDYLWKTAEKVAASSLAPWDDLDSRRYIVTGGTGLIGSFFVLVLLARNDVFHASNKIVLPVRNLDKAQRLFGSREDVDFAEWDLNAPLPELGECDFFVHAASGTSSRDFSKRPATVISSIVAGAKTSLDYATLHHASKYLFLSTMEVYGEVEGRASEGNLGLLDPMIPRNSYPESKRLVECLCSSYYREHMLPAVVVRLAQTFGQGVNRDDERVFAEFGRSAQSGNDIVLYSDGLKENMYLSVSDAVTAMLVLLAKGEPGQAYNAANEDTFCSIKEMAELVLRTFGVEGSSVRREYDKDRESSFRKSRNLCLDCSKLKQLGWKAEDSLIAMYDAMLKSW